MGSHRAATSLSAALCNRPRMAGGLYARSMELDVPSDLYWKYPQQPCAHVCVTAVRAAITIPSSVADPVRFPPAPEDDFDQQIKGASPPLCGARRGAPTALPSPRRQTSIKSTQLPPALGAAVRFLSLIDHKRTAAPGCSTVGWFWSIPLGRPLSGRVRLKATPVLCGGRREPWYASCGPGRTQGAPTTHPRRTDDTPKAHRRRTQAHPTGQAGTPATVRRTRTPDAFTTRTRMPQLPSPCSPGAGS